MDCAICMTPLEGSPDRTMSCLHRFHEKCMESFSTHNRDNGRDIRCPLCNDIIEKAELMLFESRGCVCNIKDIFDTEHCVYGQIRVSLGAYGDAWCYDKHGNSKYTILHLIFDAPMMFSVEPDIEKTIGLFTLLVEFGFNLEAALRLNPCITTDDRLFPALLYVVRYAYKVNMRKETLGDIELPALAYPGF